MLKRRNSGPAYFRRSPLRSRRLAMFGPWHRCSSCGGQESLAPLTWRQRRSALISKPRTLSTPWRARQPRRPHLLPQARRQRRPKRRRRSLTKSKDDEVIPPAKTEAAKPQADEEARLAPQADAERQRIADQAEIQKRSRSRPSAKKPNIARKRQRRSRSWPKAKRSKRGSGKNPAKLPSAGGAGATGTADAQELQGRVSASQGSILNYGASLRALISSNTPRNIRKTSLRLAFSIAPSGGLTAVDVIKPSNDPDVDKRMVELVRKLSSRFPPPPPGASATQLSLQHRNHLPVGPDCNVGV